MSALHLVVAAIAAWIAIGVLGTIRPRKRLDVIRALFILGAGVGLALGIVALFSMGQIAQSIVLPLGLPDLPFHLRLDPLSAFFLLLLGASGAARTIPTLCRRH